MSRRARVLSCTNVYHVMFRGVNKRQIFFDDEDHQYLIDTINRYKIISGYEVYAFCLMDNHFHLLIKIGQEPLGIVFRRIGDAYVFWYNKKYDRCGHLFQNRYRSEPVEDEQYLLHVWRYILQNPIKAGICKLPQEYKWSSALEYCYGKACITDMAYIFGILGDNLKDYMQKNDEDEVWRNDHGRHRLSDKEALKIIQNDNMPEEKEKLPSWVKRQITAGISVRQLSRLSGITKNRIERMKK